MIQSDYNNKDEDNSPKTLNDKVVVLFNPYPRLYPSQGY